MVDLHIYHQSTYIPNKTVAGCVAAFVSISLVAWFIQSWQVRFRPPRLSLLLLFSHIAIIAELIVRATILANKQDSKIGLIAVNSLFAIGQRMIIVSNYIFILQIHPTKAWISRVFLVSAVFCVILSGVLMGPASLLSFNPDKVHASFLFRKVSAAILVSVTLLFYVAWYWSKTIDYMTMKATLLIVVSSFLCAILAIFNLIQSIPNYYVQINSQEAWFYILQMTPIILAHFTWSIFHPKRSATSSCSPLSTNSHEILI